VRTFVYMRVFFGSWWVCCFSLLHSVCVYMWHPDLDEGCKKKERKEMMYVEVQESFSVPACVPPPSFSFGLLMHRCLCVCVCGTCGERHWQRCRHHDCKSVACVVSPSAPPLPTLLPPFCYAR
jgi:hypothetical protein